MAEQLRIGDVLARLGGDEFGILAIDAGRRRRAVARPSACGCASKAISMSGNSAPTRSAPASASSHGPSRANHGEVISQADTACYMAKEHGRNRIHFFSERRRRDHPPARRDGMGTTGCAGWSTKTACCWTTRRCCRCRRRPAPSPHIELLIRLRDEEGQVVMPGAFLPAAERYGMVSLLDRWVIAPGDRQLRPIACQRAHARAMFGQPVGVDAGGRQASSTTCSS